MISTDGEGGKGVEYKFDKPAGARTRVAKIDTSSFPVENVSWFEAKEFCERLTTKDGRGRTYRLPTEAEWEYACRGGGSSSQLFHFGDSLSSRQANFNGNYPYGGGAKGAYLIRPCKVGSYQANAFGLYDMHGNMSEWCADWYDKDYYASSPRHDPPGPSKGSRRAWRGGGWYSDGRGCRSAFRGWSTPGYRRQGLGFRVALVPSR